MLAVARLSKPRGLRGEIRADVLCGDFEHFVECAEKAQLWLWPAEPREEETPDSVRGARPAELESCRFHKGSALLQFANIDSREDAEALRGCFLAIARNELPEPGENEYYLFELQGLEIVNIDGESIGTVQDILDNPAHDQIQVRPTDGGRPFQVPFVSAFICSVDLQAGRITVDLPEGFRESQQ